MCVCVRERERGGDDHMTSLKLVLYSHDHDQLYKHICIYIYECMQNHNDTIITSEDRVIRKIYLSLYLKGLCVRGSWRPNRTATY